MLFKAIRLDENRQRVIPWALQSLKVSEMGNDKGAKMGEEEETVPIGGKEFGVTETK